MRIPRTLEAWDGGTRHVRPEDGRALRTRTVPESPGDRPVLDPTLHVADVDGRERFASRGATRRGADGDRLGRRQAGHGPDGGRPGLAAELVLLDLRDRSSTSLTDTPSVVEMQPAVAPGGERLAFADWASGVLLLGRLENGAGGAP